MNPPSIQYGGACPDTRMRDHPLEPFWPKQKLQDEDLWFYNSYPIQGYPEPGRADVAHHGRMIFLGSYSYLGLNGDPRINQAAHQAIQNYGTGAHGVRLLAGTLDIHKQLERKIADFKGTESALVFSSGFMTNVSVIASILSRQDSVIIDRLAHASIIDGCQLSRANLIRFKHNDMDNLEQCLSSSGATGRKLVIVDGVYSMDGDVADLPNIHRLCRKYEATLMVDEAHSVGVLGKTGRGIEEHFGMPMDSVDIKMGTLSKAIPSVGGYVAGSRKLCDYLSLQARGFIYSGALPAASAAAALEAFRIIEAEPARVETLHRNVEHFAAGLREIGLSYLNSTSAVFPIVCGGDWDAWRLARFCQRKGIFVQAIPHPVVPKGLARLRAAVTSAHSVEDLNHCLRVLEEGARSMPDVLRKHTSAN